MPRKGLSNSHDDSYNLFSNTCPNGSLFFRLGKEGPFKKNHPKYKLLMKSTHHNTVEDELLNKIDNERIAKQVKSQMNDKQKTVASRIESGSLRFSDLEKFSTKNNS